MSGRPPKLEIVSLAARFGPKVALSEVSLTVPKGEIVALIGPSGSGKSTVLRCINRMHELTPGATSTGKVLLDGEDVYALGVEPAGLRRRVGMVFERPAALPGFTIREDVLAGWTLRGRSPKGAEEIAETALGRVGLWAEVKDRLGAPSTSLALGQIQRLAIARTLAVRPEVLLLDEPCAGLDPVGTARIDELLSELRASVTVVLVTHNLQQAARVADTVAFLGAGTVIEHERAATLFTNPRDPRTEDFITGRFGAA
jgi:phosphate transport system ATP-binding protein